ncbi:MAG: Ig-like domain-containing protein [Candidatus Omnitrophica bacterium]|nr:Ig-like domain-containing protein [Candidatus Omnitrophota bacterium]
MKTVIPFWTVGVAVTLAATLAIDAQPQLVSSGALNSSSIGLTFSTALDPVSAANPANYSVIGGATVAEAVLRSDGKTVVLTVAGLTGTGYTVTVQGVKDSAGNPVSPGTTTTGKILGMQGVFIGDTGDPGESYSSAPDEIQVTAGGVDIWGNADVFHFAYLEQSGDFDVKAQVASFENANPWARSGLMVRESLEPGSRNLTCAATPPPGGQNIYMATVRTDTDGTTGDWGSRPAKEAAHPNVWVRLKRAGNEFVGYHGTNGLNWVEFARTTIEFPSTLYLGLCTSWAPGNSVYRNFGTTWPDAHLEITQSPTNQIVEENQNASFTVALNAFSGVTPVPASELHYQWQENGIDLPDAKAATLVLTQVTNADSGSKYRCVVTLGNASVTSADAILTVITDTTPPTIVSSSTVSAESLILGVRFSELLDATSAGILGNYSVSGGTIGGAVLRPDGKSVALTVAGLSGTSYTLTVSGVKDLAGNTIAAGTRVTGQISGMYGVFVGDTGDPGSSFSSIPGDFEVEAGGLDMYGNADNFHFTYREQMGDFDVKVQVFDIQSDNTYARSGLMVRESLAGGSRNLACAATAPVGGVYMATVRADTDGATVDWGSQPPKTTHPNVWVRLKRAGNSFSGFWSSDGLSWTAFAQRTLDMPAATFLGLCTSWGPLGYCTICGPGSTVYHQFGDFAWPDPRVELTQQPTNTVVVQGKSATFTVSANAYSGTNQLASSEISYQWQRNQADIPGANSAILTLSQVTTSDNSANYRCVVSLRGASATSDAATLTVSNDTQPPIIESTAALNADSIGVRFNEPVDPATAGDSGNYTVSGGASVIFATLRPDGQTVALSVTGLTGTNYTVTARGVRDLVGNTSAAGTSATGVVMGLQAVLIGDGPDPGESFSSAPGDIEVVAGGVDIWGNADNFHFAYLEQSGDFDIKVQVASFENANPWARSGLMVRESLEPGSRNLTCAATPPPAGQNCYMATIRTNTDDLTGDWGSRPAKEAAHPNIWVRLKRTGNEFVGYHGTNGFNWVEFARTTMEFPSSLYLGLCTSWAPGNTAYRNFGGTWSDVQIEITQPPVDLTVEENHSASFTVVANAFSGTNQLASADLSFQWQLNGVDLAGANQATLALSQVTKADNGAKYRCLVSVGNAMVTSSMATLTVSTDVTPPSVVSSGTVTGEDLIIGLRFSEPLDPASAGDKNNYTVAGATVSAVELRADGQSVELTVTGLTTPSYTVSVNGVKDLAGNAVPSGTSVTGQVSDIHAILVGATGDAGSSFSSAPGEFDVEAGGGDIWGTADNFHFTYRQQSGDFDVQVQVFDTQNANQWARNGIMFRESLVAGSPEINAMAFARVNNYFEAFLRSVPDGETTTWSSPAAPPRDVYPNVWLRLNRVGNQFTSLRSLDGITWIQLGQTTLAMSNSGFLGLATPWPPGTTQYRHFGDYNPPNLGRLNVTLQSGQVSITWTSDAILQSAPEVAGPWSDVTGAASPWSVTPATGHTFYRLRSK